MADRQEPQTASRVFDEVHEVQVAAGPVHLRSHVSSRDALEPNDRSAGFFPPLGSQFQWGGRHRAVLRVEGAQRSL